MSITPSSPQILRPKKYTHISGRSLDTLILRMQKSASFHDYDDEEVYTRTREHLIDPQTLNFVAEFRQYESRIAVDLDASHMRSLLEERQSEPSGLVRWM